MPEPKTFEERLADAEAHIVTLTRISEIQNQNMDNLLKTIEISNKAVRDLMEGVKILSALQS